MALAKEYGHQFFVVNFAHFVPVWFRTIFFLETHDFGFVSVELPAFSLHV